MYKATLKKLRVSLQPIYDNSNDDWLKSRLAGLVTIEASSSFETAIKNAIVDFCHARDTVFGNFMEVRYRRLQGRIKVSDLKSEFLVRFGESYQSGFEARLKIINDDAKKNFRDEPGNRYDALLTNRHDFAHTGSLGITFTEALEYFEDACKVVEALEDTLGSP